MRQTQSNSFSYSIITVGILLCVACTSKKPKEESIANNSTEMKSGRILSAPQKKLIELVGTWTVVRSSFIDKTERLKGEVVGTAAADSTAIYTIFKQGSGKSYYEASALWGYSESARQVQIFEINSLGFVGTHLGTFDSTGTLNIEYRDLANDVLQQRKMRWNRDTLEMTAMFTSNGKTEKHYSTCVRKKD